MKKFTGIFLAGVLSISAATSMLTNVNAAPKKLIVWHMMEPKVEKVVEKAFIPFEKKNNIDVVFVRQENLTQKVEMLGNTSDSVDALIGPQDWVGRFATMGLIDNIDSSIDKKVLKDYKTSALNCLKYDANGDGKKELYGLPCYAETVLLAYNKNLIKTPPKNTDELLNIAKTMTKDGKYGFLTQPTDAYFNSAFVYGYGGSYIDEKGNATLNNKNTIKAFEFLKKLGKYYPKNLDAGTLMELFKKGKAATAIVGPWNLPDLKAAKVNYGLAKLPLISDTKKAASPYMGVQTGLVMKNSSNKKDALKFLEYYASENVSSALSKALGSVPANKKAYNDPEVKKNPEVVAISDQIDDAIPMPIIPQMAVMWTPIQNALQEIVTLNGDVKKSADEQNKKAQQSIDNMK